MKGHRVGSRGGSGQGVKGPMVVRDQDGGNLGVTGGQGEVGQGEGI